MIAPASIVLASTETVSNKQNDSCSDAVALSKEINAPVLLKKVEPDFRKLEDAQDRAGTSMIAEAVVTKEGSLSCIKILRPNDPDLDQILMDALLQWKYKPATRKGKPVPIRLTITAKVEIKS